MAGPLVMRSGAPSSAAMIIAIVVLPRPGGPESRMWSGGRAAAHRALEHQRELLADPVLADELVERLGPQRVLDLALVDGGERRDRVVVALERREVDVGRQVVGVVGHVRLRVRSAARSRAVVSVVSPVSASAATASTAVSASRAE